MPAMRGGMAVGSLLTGLFVSYLGIRKALWIKAVGCSASAHGGTLMVTCRIAGRR